MAAAIPAIMTAVKVVGTVMSVVTMVQGLKNGNLGQAIVGGFGAFMGMSSLAAGAANTAGNTAASSLSTGADAVGKAALPIMGDTSTAALFGPTGPGAVSGTASNLLSGGSGGLLDVGSKSIIGSGLATGNNALLGSVADNTARAAGPMDKILNTGKDVFGSVKDGISGLTDAARENPDLLKLGGGLLQGYSQGQQKEEELKYLKKLEDEKRRRIGQTFVPNTSPFAV